MSPQCFTGVWPSRVVKLLTARVGRVALHGRKCDRYKVQNAKVRDIEHAGNTEKRTHRARRGPGGWGKGPDPLKVGLSSDLRGCWGRPRGGLGAPPEGYLLHLQEVDGWQECCLLA